MCVFEKNKEKEKKRTLTGELTLIDYRSAHIQYLYFIIWIAVWTISACSIHCVIMRIVPGPYDMAAEGQNSKIACCRLPEL